MIRATGLLPDDGRLPRRRFDARRLGASNVVRGHADLRAHAGPVVDQGSSQSCAACSVLSACCTTLAASGAPLGFVPSILHGYQLALRLDRARYSPGPGLPRLRDRGTQILSVVEGLQKYGMRRTGSSWAPGAHCDCSASSAVDEGALDLDDVVRSRAHVVVGSYEITGTTSTRLREAKLALDAGVSCVIGGWVDSRTMAYQPGDPPLGEQDLKDPNGGGHAVELVGYDADGWIIKNSWGLGWGHTGYGYVTDEYIGQQWSIFALSVRRRVT